MARKTRTTGTRATVGTQEQLETAALEPKELNPTEAMMAMMLEMQKQISAQNAVITKFLSKQDKDTEQVFQKPPSDTTIVNDAPTHPAVSPEVRDGAAGPVAVDPGKARPGEYRPGDQWVPWSPDDIKDLPKVRFVPFPIPGLVWPQLDDEGRQKIRLIKNDLECWLTVGEENIVSEYFYDHYKDSYEHWKRSEEFKRRGGPGPWVAGGPRGENTWTFKAEALSFGMDEDGRPITIDKTIWDSLPASADMTALNPLEQ